MKQGVFRSTLNHKGHSEGVLWTKIFTKDTKGKMTEPVIEIKSVEALNDVHLAQTLIYEIRN